MCADSRLENPFLPLRADNIRDEEVVRFFANHGKCAPIAARGNQLVLGVSGTGKTIALRYLSFQNQLKSGEVDPSSPPRFIGVYAPLNRDCDVWRKKDPTSDILTLYENALSMRLASEILNVLNHIAESGFWHVTSRRVIDLICSSVGIGRTARDIAELRGEISSRIASIVSHVDRSMRPTVGGLGLTLSAKVGSFIPKLCERVIESVGALGRETALYLLLDQYDELSAWQQRIVNILIRRPSDPYYVKVGCRPFGVHDRTTVAGRPIYEALEGVVDLQFYRREAESFTDVVLEIMARRLHVADEEADLAALAARLLPEERPLRTAGKAYLWDNQLTLGDMTQERDSDLAAILEQLSNMGTDIETRRQLRSCVYQGFKTIVSLADGNIGAYLTLLSRMWNHTRINRKGNPSEPIDVLPSPSQVIAVWDFANDRFDAIESMIPDDGTYVSNLVRSFCDFFEKGLSSGATFVKTHDIEVPDGSEIAPAAVEKLKAAFQYGVFLPTSSAGHRDIPKNFNVSKFYLPKWGLIHSKCRTLSLRPETLRGWIKKPPAGDITPPRKAPARRHVDEHLGFLSISFRKEEPASAARGRIQDIFDTAEPKIRCFDFERFKDRVGSKALLNRIKEAIKKEATFCLIEASNITPNVMIEFGLTKGLRKLFWLLVHEDKVSGVPEWLAGLDLVSYSLTSSNEQSLERIVSDRIIQQLKSVEDEIRDFCPIQSSARCPFPVSKDRSRVFLCYPEGHEIWTAAAKDLKQVLPEHHGRKPVVLEDTSFSIGATPHKVCGWCYAIRSAGTVIVDTTPLGDPASQGADVTNDPTQCFVLGLAFGQKQRTQCIHLFKRGVGAEMTLWKGHPSWAWSTKDEIVSRVVDALRGPKGGRVR